MTAQLSSHVHVWRPAPGARRTLLLLHGTGGDEHDLLPLAGALDPAANVLSPRGNVLENGAPRFFARHGPGRLDVDDLRRRARDLAAFVDAAAARYGFPRDAVTAVGFSNGANVAAGMLFEAPQALRAAVLLRAMLPYRPPAPPRLEGRRVLLLAGRHDPYSQPEMTEGLAGILREGGARVDVHYAEAGHELTPTDVEMARRWLAEGGTP